MFVHVNQAKQSLRYVNLLQVLEFRDLTLKSKKKVMIKTKLSVTWFCLLRNCGDATRDFNGELVKKASTGDWIDNGEGSCGVLCSNF